MIILLLMGWPAIIGFVLLASYGAWQNKAIPLAIASIWSLPNSIYLLTGNNWVQFAGIFIPVSLVISAVAVQLEKAWPARVLLLPIYGFYLWLGRVVLTQ
jgi:hypothetical protein